MFFINYVLKLDAVSDDGSHKRSLLLHKERTSETASTFQSARVAGDVGQCFGTASLKLGYLRRHAYSTVSL